MSIYDGLTDEQVCEIKTIAELQNRSDVYSGVLQGVEDDLNDLICDVALGVESPAETLKRFISIVDSFKQSLYENIASENGLQEA